jgi:hypothetical protein
MSQKNNGLVGMVLGIAAGVAAAAAGCVAAMKVANEIKNDFQETAIISPEGNNCVTITCGSSSSARGLTFIKLCAENESDHCDFSFLAGKRASKISFNWKDNDNICFTLGDGAVKKVCDVCFEGGEIVMKLYFRRDEEPETNEEVVEVEATEKIEE